MLKNLGLTDTHKVIQGSYNVLVCCRDGVALVAFSYRRVGGGGRGRVGKWEASNHPPLPYFPHFLHILSSRPSLPGPPPSSNLLCSSSSLCPPSLLPPPSSYLPFLHIPLSRVQPEGAVSVARAGAGAHRDQTAG